MNSGTIGGANTGTYDSQAASLRALQGMTIDNSGRIDGGLYTALRSNDAAASVSFGVANSGTITNSNGATAASFAIDARENGGTASIDNSGTQARFRMLRRLIGSTDRIGVPDRLVETA